MLLLARPNAEGRYERVAFSPDGGLLVGATNTGQVLLVAMADRSGSDVLARTIEGRTLFPGVSDIGFSPDSRYLLVGLGSPPGLLIRDMQQGIDLTENAMDHVTGLAVAPLGNGF